MRGWIRRAWVGGLSGFRREKSPAPVADQAVAGEGEVDAMMNDAARAFSGGPVVFVVVVSMVLMGVEPKYRVNL